ncbi:MAG: transketolase C-terminal domain-containing protein, partial [Hyphomicrobiales bacterium]|nr:transketolase C-terminal domain-containing protein [Hyphomicrobiales bacterium]
GYGPILKLGMDAAEALDGEMSVGVASVHTLKPLDAQGIARALARYPRVVVIEEMVPRGGLGDAVKAIAWESGATCSLRCLSLRDAFLHRHGSHADVLGAHGLSVSAVASALRGVH